jgi:hypothetical protein
MQYPAEDATTLDSVTPLRYIRKLSAVPLAVTVPSLAYVWPATKSGSAYMYSLCGVGFDFAVILALAYSFSDYESIYTCVSSPFVRMH